MGVGGGEAEIFVMHLLINSVDALIKSCKQESSSEPHPHSSAHRSLNLSRHSTIVGLSSYEAYRHSQLQISLVAVRPVAKAMRLN